MSNETNKTENNESPPETETPSRQDQSQITQESVLVGAQNNLNTSLGILRTTASIALVVVTAIAFIFTLMVAFGIFETHRWRTLRKEAETILHSAQEKTEAIDEMRKRVEVSLNKLREKAPPLRVPSKPSKDLIKDADKFALRFELYELLGIPLKANDYINLGRLFIYKDEYDTALEYYEKAIEVDPTNGLGWINKSHALLSLDRFEEALRAAEKAIEMSPQNVLGWVNKSASLQGLRRYNEAMSAVEKALEINPNHTLALADKSIFTLQMKRPKEALALSQRIVEINPNDDWGWLVMSIVLSELDRHEEALVAAEKAVEVNPEDTVSWLNKSDVLFDLGRPEEALSAIETAIELESNSVHAWAYKASLLSKIGNHTESKKALERALRIGPKSSLDYYSIAIVFALQGDKDKALQYLRRSTETAPYLKDFAKEDEDFKSLWDDDDFKRIIK